MVTMLTKAELLKLKARLEGKRSRFSPEVKDEMLRYLIEHSYAATARKFGCSVGTIQQARRAAFRDEKR
jgi:transposase-like protein